MDRLQTKRTQPCIGFTDEVGLSMDGMPAAGGLGGKT
jgi:hypothetical protein